MGHQMMCGHVFLLRGDANRSAMRHGLRCISAQVEDDLLKLRRLARYHEVFRDVFDPELDAGRQRGTQQCRRLLEQGTHLHRPDPRVTLPSECKDVIDQIAAALGRASYLFDMLCRLGSTGDQWFDHLGIAKNGADDVVKVVRDPARQ